VQQPDPVGVVRGEPGAHGVGEQVVIAVPLALVVERDDEEVRAFQGVQRLPPVVATREGVAQGPGQLVEDAGVEEERTDVVALSVQDLLEQVVQDEAAAPGEGVHEVADVRPGVGRPAPDRQGRELQPGDPPLRPGLERGDMLRAEAQAHDVVEEGGGLVLREPQVGGAHLAQLAAGSQPGQRQRRVRPGGHRHGDLRGQVVEQERHRVVHGRLVDEVVVVQGEHRRPGQRVQVVHQADQDVLGRRWAVGAQQSLGLRTGLRDGDLHRGHQVREEPAQVGVTGVQREPGHPERPVGAGRAQPLGQQGRLAEPGRCRDEQEPRHRPGTGAQRVDQPCSRDELAARGRDLQLGAQDRHGVSVGPPPPGASGGGAARRYDEVKVCDQISDPSAL